MWYCRRNNCTSYPGDCGINVHVRRKKQKAATAESQTQTSKVNLVAAHTGLKFVVFVSCRDNNSRQNIEQDKEVPKRVASPHSDNTDDDDEVERNFDNPLYAKVCREDQNNCDTLCHSTTL